ncbi:hypothetical protein ACIA4J_09070 [Lactobacillus delbrueckii subsp. bulgaricus]
MAEIDWSQVMPNLLAGKTTAYIRQNRLAISKYLKDKFNLVLDQDLHLRAYSKTRPEAFFLLDRNSVQFNFTIGD